ncbi:MAG: methyltransferase domain-containing protein [Acidobacteria bacterium]|nr:methyltransferase domain-containing protein [Acidobacteriota bacterium]
MSRLKYLLPALSFFLFVAQSTQQRRDPVSYIKTLESEQRVKGLQVDRVVEVLKVSPGQKVADLGSGSGLFSRPIARQAGEKGIVYAIDIDPELLKHIEKTAQESKLNNIRTVLATEDDPKIPEPVNLIIIIDTLHHIKNRTTYLKILRRYLQPSGRIAVIDFTRTWPPGHEEMRYTLDDLDGWMKSAGFSRLEKHDFLDNNFFVIYQ